jgi:putative hydrolase of the HAD superfamily
VTVDAVLFDLGGVILSSPFDAFARYEREHALPEGFIRSVNATRPDTNAWARLERNQISVDEFAAAFEEESAAMGHRIPGWDVLALLAGDVRPEMVDAVRRCAQRLKTGLLTNNVAGLGTHDGLADLLEHFDAVVESSVVGVRKPDPAFYEVACELLHIEPHQAVFLDDLGINLKPARAMGMHTIKVTDPGRAIAELEQVVGFPLA